MNNNDKDFNYVIGEIEAIYYNHNTILEDIGVLLLPKFINLFYKS